MDRPPPTVVRVADIAPVLWRNGGGMTRELLAWPDRQDWSLRVSVADIHSSGPFSIYAGIDRWIAVLEGGAVCLETAGGEPLELGASNPALHAFSGDAATHCIALGAATRDFNLMARRSRVRLSQRSVHHCRLLESRADGAGLFVTQAAELRHQPGPPWALPAMALAWWPNPRRELLSLHVESPNIRGWWFEVETVSPDDLEQRGAA